MASKVANANKCMLLPKARISRWLQLKSSWSQVQHINLTCQLTITRLALYVNELSGLTCIGLWLSMWNTRVYGKFTDGCFGYAAL